MRLTGLTLTGTLLLLATACDGLPERYVLVSSSYAPLPGLRSCVSDDRVTWDCGPMAVFDSVTPFPPGIATDNEIYVAAAWPGIPASRMNVPGVGLVVSVDGVNWDRAEDTGAGPTPWSPSLPSSLDRHSRLAVAYHYGTDTWFVAFRDALTGKINVLEYDIYCVGTGEYGSDCDDYKSEQKRAVVEFSGVGSSVAPSLGFVVDEQDQSKRKLVLAYVPENSRILRIYRSEDGVTWDPQPPNAGSQAVVVTASGNPRPIRADGAPYLNSSPGDVLLLATIEKRTGLEIRDVHIWSSEDGLEWEQVSTIDSVTTTAATDPSDPFATLFEPAIAGPETEMVAAFPTADYAIGQSPLHTIWSADVNQNALPEENTGSPYSAGLAFGPAP